MTKDELDKAADLMAEEINSGNPDIGKCLAIGLKAMKNYNFEIQRQQNGRLKIRRLRKT